ncbi:MAG TPA: ABC transporter permease, partial [Blastocatellia bacterium]|nr:ABC transporter permease [Blastocatellia bacterium]
MQVIWQDLRYGLRLLFKSPNFAAVAVLIIALAIGANTAIFSFVNALLLRPLEAVTDPESLAQILQTNDDNVSEFQSFRDCLDFQEQNRTLSGLAMHWRAILHLSSGQEVERIEGALVTGGYFELLGIRPAAGRLFTPTDIRAEGEDSIVVLSHSLWRTRFGAAPGIIGGTIRLNGLGYTVIGVAAEGFRGVVTGEQADVWIPATMWRQADPQMARGATTWKVDWFAERDAVWLKAFGRLKPGVTMEQAQADLAYIAQRLARNYPETNQKVGVRLAPGLGLPPSVRDSINQFVKIPIVIAGIVLLIVCANVAAMILARAAGRRKEIGIRLAMGASRWRIVRQLLTESLLLAIVGGLLGLFFGKWLGDWIRTSLPETYLSAPLKFELALDMRVFGFTLAITVLTGLLSGLAPTWQSSRLDLIPLLKDAPGRNGQAGRFRLRELLVVTQVTLSMAMLVIAGLCVRTLQNARAIDTGFDADRVLTARIDLGRQNYTEAEGHVFYQRLLERLETTPGVEVAGLALNAPLSELQTATQIFPESLPPESARPLISFNVVTPRYMEATGIRLLLGRHFSARDNLQAPRVAIINETLARRRWPDENPIGKRFRFGMNDPDTPLIEIVGVARGAQVA